MHKLKNPSSFFILSLVISFYLFFLLYYSRRMEGNLSGFACIGDYFLIPETGSRDTSILKNSSGYDGQFFYYICFDPFLTGRIHKGMDMASYRYQRILYPWMVCLISAGKSALFPYALIAVNLLSVLAGTLFCMLFLKQKGLSSWLGFCYALTSGFLIACLRDLSEPLSMAFLMAGLYWYSLRRFGWSVFCFSFAILAREIMLLVILCVLLEQLLQKRDWKFFWGYLFSFIPYGLWQIYVFWRLKQTPFEDQTSNVGLPFKALFAYTRQLFSLPDKKQEQTYLLLCVLLILCLMILSFREVKRSVNAYSLSFLVFALLPAFFSSKVWSEPWSYGRVLLPLFVLMIINFIQRQEKLYYVPLIWNFSLFVITLWWQKIIFK